MTGDIKVYAFIVKKRGLSDEAFHAHWREPHGRLTKSVPQINRYLQNHGVGSIPTVPGLPTTPYLGIATIWVSSLERLAAIRLDPGFKAVHEDEANLLESDRLMWYVTHESIVTRGPSPDSLQYVSTKALIFLKRAAAVSDTSFTVAVKSLANFAPAMMHAGRVSYGFPVPDAYSEEDPAPYDAVIEIGFADDVTFEAEWSRHGEASLGGLAKKSDLSASCGFLAHEERVIWPPFKP